jgi:DNA-binding response OmpR family regulator
MNDEPAATSQKKILVIDDNETILKSVSMKLQSAGYKVIVSEDPSQGLSAVRKEKPDLVLVDISFPPDVSGMSWDGFRVIDWLRRVEETKNIPVVIISGTFEEKYRARIPDCGAVAFLPKPVDFDKMLKVIRETLRSKTHKNTVLFVEDNPLLVTAYRGCFLREGLTLEVAGDGEAAMEMLPRLKPDLVILDLMLPRADGIEVLNFIRGHAELQATPVMILSNYYVDNAVSNSLTAGANKKLPKTQCTPATLIQAVRELLGQTRGAEPLPIIDDPHHQAASVAKIEALVQETRRNLFKDASHEIAKMRGHCVAFVKMANSPAGPEQLYCLFETVRYLCARAALADCTKLANLASALEAMLFEINFKKLLPSQSALQTIRQAVDCLDRLCQKGDAQPEQANTVAKVLIVDDDPICNFATETAMKRAGLNPTSTSEPQAALEMARNERFDIVLLDISMPGMDGFEVCKGLRQLAGYEKTPIVFITSYGEFQNRAQVVLSGGNDIIAKPIAPLELVVKTIIHLLEPKGPSPLFKSKIQLETLLRPEPVVSRASEQSEPDIGRLSEIPADRGMGEHKNPAAPAATRRQGAQHDSAPPAAAPFNDDTDAGSSFAPRPESTKAAHPLSPIKPPAFRRDNPQSDDDNRKPTMKTRNDHTQPFELLACEVARIIFGDEKLTEVSLRLTRIALDHYHIPEIINRYPDEDAKAAGASPAGVHNQLLDQVSRAVARIIFGDEGISETNLRLTRIALEHYNVREILDHSPETKERSGPPVGNRHGVIPNF